MTQQRPHKGFPMQPHHTPCCCLSSSGTGIGAHCLSWQEAKLASAFSTDMPFLSIACRPVSLLYPQKQNTRVQSSVELRTWLWCHEKVSFPAEQQYIPRVDLFAMRKRFQNVINCSNCSGSWETSNPSSFWQPLPNVGSCGSNSRSRMSFATQRPTLRHTCFRSHHVHRPSRALCNRTSAMATVKPGIQFRKYQGLGNDFVLVIAVH